jgi:hypothetical protein
MKTSQHCPAHIANVKEVAIGNEKMSEIVIDPKLVETSILELARHGA